MLDLDHPQSAHISAASNQLDFILKFAKNITLSTGKCRHDLFLIVEPAFVALRWLNEKRFQESPDIAAAITELEQAVKTLSEMAHDTALQPERKECPVCHDPATECGTYQPHGVTFTVPAERYCSRCLNIILPACIKLESGESGFGTEAI